jgi:hypothetical protein
MAERRWWRGLLVAIAVGAAILMLVQLRVARIQEESQAALQVDRFQPMSGQIVHSPSPDPTAPAFRLVQQHVMTVGLVRGDLNSELWAVADAVLTETGKLVVINPYDEVRVFDEHGQFIRRVGGKGEGPGDITFARQLAPLAGDSFAVWDERLHRITMFDQQGEPVSTTNLAINAVCCFRDGAFLLRSGRVVRFSKRTQSNEVVDWWISPAVLGPATPKPLFVLEGDDRLIGVHVGGFRGSTAYFLPPFARSASVKLTNDHIVYGRGDTYEVRVYARDGAIARVIRTPAVMPITRQDLAATRKAFTTHERPDRRRAYTRAWNRLEIPETMPAYARILVEEAGVVWVSGYTPLGSRAPEWWARFDEYGRLTGTLQTPDSLRIVRFTRGHVISRERRDTDGFVVLHVTRVEPLRL